MPGDLFFVALLPGPEISAEVTGFKRYAQQHFRTSRALRSPPHITLYPPFRWPVARIPEVEQVLRGLARAEKPFNIHLKDFRCFRPRVIYVQVIPDPRMVDLHQRVRDEFQNELGLDPEQRREYKPHMTVAFKDLRRSAFPRAWAYFSSLSYERIFLADRITLLRHVDRQWHPFRQFEFDQET